ncbi:MAG: hypothetical protein HY909_19465 [Deltaproteobacteria bacterium]|nr:hypothetical protein [Deltaproteobacteria bacterium]
MKSIPGRRGASRKPVAIGSWPAEARTPDELAAEVQYLGSPEHKDYVNPVNREAPRQRSDAFRCEEYPAEQWPRFTRLLQEAVRMQCTSAEFDPDQRPGLGRPDGWPRYVWGWFKGALFQARHRTDPPGHFYKAWLLEPEDHPEDPDDRLGALRTRLEALDV